MKSQSAVRAACATSLALTLALGAGPAGAASKPVYLDRSNANLMDAATAAALLDKQVPAAFWKLYPASKWGIATMVEGGFTDAKVCVVTASVMLAPLTVSKKMLLKPQEMATSFDAVPNATLDECKAAAKKKLGEAIDSVVSSVVSR